MPEEEPSLYLKLAEKRGSRICRKSSHNARKPTEGEAGEHTLSRASRVGRGEAETQAEEGPAGPRRVAARREEAASRTCMGSAQSLFGVQRDQVK